MEYGPLPAEDIIENQKLQLSKFAEELEQLQRENRKLKEETILLTIGGRENEGFNNLAALGRFHRREN